MVATRGPGSHSTAAAGRIADVPAVDEAPPVATEAAEAAAERINRGFPNDFVARIRDLQQAGGRDPQPGAVDSWLDDDSD